jgi:hypothetical protein
MLPINKQLEQLIAKLPNNTTSDNGQNIMTKAICFFNNGQLDRRSFTMLGLSAKSDDRAIGFFGTGFKYAIATLLRHGAKIHIVAGKDDEYVFYTSPDTFRGKEIQVIYVHHMSTHRETELPFHHTSRC